MTQTTKAPEIYLHENWQTFDDDPDGFYAKDYTLYVVPSEGLWEWSVLRPVYSRQEPPYDDVVKTGRHPIKAVAQAFAESWDKVIEAEEELDAYRAFIQFLDWEYRQDGIDDADDGISEPL